MPLPVSKPDLGEHYLDYTWLISGVLYEGGTDLLIPELMKKISQNFMEMQLMQNV